MKLLQTLLFLLVFSTISQNTSAQSIRFKTTSMSISEKDEKGKWSNWSDFAEAELMIILDVKKDRIIVNSKDLQLYKIASYGDKIVTETDDIVPFECVDNEGAKCAILIITRKKENNRMQFYINYPQTKLVYNIYTYD